MRRFLPCSSISAREALIGFLAGGAFSVLSDFIKFQGPALPLTIKIRSIDMRSRDREQHC